MKKYSLLSHIFSYILPVTAAGIIPYFILRGHDMPAEGVLNLLRLAAGIAVSGAGLGLLAYCIYILSTAGKGTLAPWSPTKKLALKGPYMYTRNPMISGVLIIILGEAIACASFPVLAWAAAFFITNNIYFALFEEPGLEKRFGRNYRNYKKQVPRWLPNMRAGRKK